MGCGITQNKHPNFLYSNLPLPKELITDKVKLNSKKTKPSSLYLFGINEVSKPLIILFDAMSESFSFKEIPSNLEIFNYSTALYLTQNSILISGGINQAKTEISNKVFLYNPILNTSKILSNMNQSRYTHITILYNGFVFVIGGGSYSQNDDGLLKAVESYDFKTNLWTVRGSLNKPRCTGFACIFKSEIYVFGGYTGPLKRSRVFERYNSKTDLWTILDFKLQRGIECGLIFSIHHNEIIIVGGQTKAGPTSSIHSINLLKKTIHYKSKMANSRVLQKGFEYNGILYIFGGDNTSIMEKACINNWEWTEIQSKYTNFISIEQLEKFSQSICTINVPYSLDPVENKLENNKNDEILNLFGTDNEPFILEFNLTKIQAKSLPTPLSLRLYSYQSGVKLTENQYFLCGGIHYQMDQISNKSYIYETDKKIVEFLPSMNQERYTFNTLLKTPYIYVLGGRTYGEDHDAILKSCERFNILDKKWQKIADLNLQRCSSMSFIIKEKIFIFGGYKGDGERHTSIEKYNENLNIWELNEINLQEGIEAGTVELISDNKILILGGRLINGDTNKVILLEINKDLFDFNYTEYGNIESERCLHKTYRIKNYKFNDFIIIFGGDELKSVEFFNIKKKKIDLNEELLKIAEEFKLEIDFSVGDQKLKRYLLL